MKLLKGKYARLSILIITLVSAILAIVFGSVFYVKKNVRKSIEYQGGAEYLLKVNPEANFDFDGQEAAQAIYERINPLGSNAATSEVEKKGSNINVRVQYPGKMTIEQKADIERLIANKPQLIITDVYGNPLFDENGLFNSSLSPGVDPQGFVTQVNGKKVSVIDYYNPPGSTPGKNKLPSVAPLASGGAKANAYNVAVKLDEKNGKDEWAKASSYISKLNRKEIFMWFDPQFIISKIMKSKSDFLTDYKVYGNSNFYETILSQAIIFGNINFQDYMIGIKKIEAVEENSESFDFNVGFNSTAAQNLARKINFGTAKYSLQTLYAKPLDATYGQNAFNKVLIAGIVVFSLIALILMVNYGLLGALSVMSIGLYLFTTIFFFTVMKGEYSPASIAALILGIGMSVDSSIITYERLKTQMYVGHSLKKAFYDSNRKTWSTIFDSNTTTMLVALVLFYFGTRSIIGLSITLIISIVATLMIMVLFNKFVATMLIKSYLFNNHKFLAGLKPKLDNKVQDKINNVDFMKNAKTFIRGSLLFGVIGIAMFFVFAGLKSEVYGGFNLSQEFTGGMSLTIVPKAGQVFTSAETNSAINYLAQQGIDSSNVHVAQDLISYKTQVPFANTQNVQQVLENIFTRSSAGAPLAIVSITNTPNQVAANLAKDAVIALVIAIVLVMAYTMIRFRWTFSLAAIIALIHDVLFILAAFVIFQITIEPIFVAAVLLTIGYSINDTIITFDRIREKMLTHVGKLDKDKIAKVANEAIRDTLKRSLWTSLTTSVAVLVLIAFGNATKISFNLAMLFGLFAGTYSSIFIATFLWVKLETYRQRKIVARQNNAFWKTEGLEEQTINGINDFKV